MATVTIKCPNCGGGLQFDPASRQYKCEYCLSSFTQETLDELLQQMQEKDEAKKDELKKEPEGESQQSGSRSDGENGSRPDRESGSRPDGESGSRPDRENGSRPDGESGTGDGGAADAVIYTCPSCGAEIVTDETTAASFCFYCHNPVILQGRLDGQYQPDLVIPFSIDREKAREIFLEWLKKKRFVPASFYAPEQIEKLTGVYFPYWLYSCQIDGRIDAEATKLRIWNMGNIQYTETSRFQVSRKGLMKIHHVTRNALKKADKQLVEGVMPFETAALTPFSMGFLAGFFAEKRDLNETEFAGEVESEVRSFAEQDLKSSISGYNSVTVKSQVMDIREPQWQYALLPVWTLTYRDRNSGAIYYFACNGQTGKVCGKLPVDAKKLGLFFAEIFFPLLFILLAAGYFI